MSLPRRILQPDLYDSVMLFPLIIYGNIAVARGRDLLIACFTTGFFLILALIATKGFALITVCYSRILSIKIATAAVSALVGWLLFACLWIQTGLGVLEFIGFNELVLFISLLFRVFLFVRETCS